jgi:hypothetical protein
MMVMFVYNLLLFMSIRERSYILYTIFIAFWILFQMTLNGLSFQHLWPNSIWWANNCLPLFVGMSTVMGLFSRDYMQTRARYPKMDKIIIFGIVLPGLACALAAFTGNYKLSIKINTINGAYFSTAMIVLAIILSLRGSRSARFFLLAWAGLLLGVIAYALKTLGVFPINLFTTWGIQIGSSMMVVLLSLGLADKINIMQKDLRLLNADMEKNEQEARKRAEYLEGVVNTVKSISGDLLKIGYELSSMGAKFSEMATEQASTSEEMSATFEELANSNDIIYKRTITQRDQGAEFRHGGAAEDDIAPVGDRPGGVTVHPHHQRDIEVDQPESQHPR